MRQTFLTLLIFSSLASCGKNVVSSYAPGNEQEKAELDMEAGRYSQAAERLNSVLLENPENYTAKSLLAAAYAGQANITTLGLIKNASSTSTSSDKGAQKFNSILPEVSIASLDLMALACATMEAIPTDSRSIEMKLQHSLFFSAYALMQVKYLTSSPEALANITAEDAAKLILTLSKAGEASGSSPLSKAAASLSATIESSPGDSINKVKAALGAPNP